MSLGKPYPICGPYMYLGNPVRPFGAKMLVDSTLFPVDGHPSREAVKSIGTLKLV